MTRHLTMPDLFGLEPEDGPDMDDVTERVREIASDLGDEGPEVVVDDIELALADALKAAKLADSKAERLDEELSAAALMGGFVVLACFVDGADVDYALDGDVANLVAEPMHGLVADVHDGPELARERLSDALADCTSMRLRAALSGALIIAERLAAGGAA